MESNRVNIAKKSIFPQSSNDLGKCDGQECGQGNSNQSAQSESVKE